MSTIVLDPRDLETQITSRERLNGLNIGQYITRVAVVRVDPQRVERRRKQLFALQRQQARLWNRLVKLQL